MHSAENVYHYITKNTFTVLPINSIMKFRVTTEFALFYTHFETGTLRKLRWNEELGRQSKNRFFVNIYKIENVNIRGQN